MRKPSPAPLPNLGQPYKLGGSPSNDTFERPLIFTAKKAKRLKTREQKFDEANLLEFGDSKMNINYVTPSKQEAFASASLLKNQSIPTRDQISRTTSRKGSLFGEFNGLSAHVDSGYHPQANSHAKVTRTEERKSKPEIICNLPTTIQIRDRKNPVLSQSGPRLFLGTKGSGRDSTIFSGLKGKPLIMAHRNPESSILQAFAPPSAMTILCTPKGYRPAPFSLNPTSASRPNPFNLTTENSQTDATLPNPFAAQTRRDAITRQHPANSTPRAATEPLLDDAVILDCSRDRSQGDCLDSSLEDRQFDRRLQQSKLRLLTSNEKSGERIRVGLDRIENLRAKKIRERELSIQKKSEADMFGFSLGQHIMKLVDIDDFGWDNLVLKGSSQWQETPDEPFKIPIEPIATVKKFRNHR